MNKTMIFTNTYMSIDNGEVFQVMYLHKGFAILDMNEGNVSLMPLSLKEIDELVSSPLNIMNEVKDVKTIQSLNEFVGNLDASVERAKLAR